MNDSTRTNRHDTHNLAEGEALGTPTKVGILILALLLGLADHAMGGWGQIAFGAAIAVIAPIIGYRKFWGVGAFWMAAGLLAVAQVPFVIKGRSLIEAAGFVSVLAFAVVDCVFVTLVIAFVCSRYQDPRHNRLGS